VAAAFRESYLDIGDKVAASGMPIATLNRFSHTGSARKSRRIVPKPAHADMLGRFTRAKAPRSATPTGTGDRGLAQRAIAAAAATQALGLIH
jgi:hypothetical protein